MDMCHTIYFAYLRQNKRSKKTGNILLLLFSVKTTSAWMLVFKLFVEWLCFFLSFFLSSLPPSSLPYPLLPSPLLHSFPFFSSFPFHSLIYCLFSIYSFDALLSYMVLVITRSIIPNVFNKYCNIKYIQRHPFLLRKGAGQHRNKMS